MTAAHARSSTKEARKQLLCALGATIRFYRRDRVLTQKELAQAVDVSVAHMSLIERGRRNPPITMVIAIAHALGVSLREIFGD